MSLDFESQDFDPLVALAAPDIELPYEDVQPLNNLSEYYNVTKGGSTATKRQLSTKKSHNLAQNVVASTSNVFEVQRPPVKRLKTVLTIMEEIQGPLGRLRHCMKEQIPVKVWTRRADEIRGVCTGYILAFDRHWNLIMSDVDETYILPKNLKTIPLGPQFEVSEKTLEVSSASCSRGEHSGEHSSKSKKTHSSTVSADVPPPPPSGRSHRKRGVKQVELKQRHVNQIFVRGDNVAFISISSNSLNC